MDNPSLDRVQPRAQCTLNPRSNQRSFSKHDILYNICGKLIIPINEFVRYQTTNIITSEPVSIKKHKIIQYCDHMYIKLM
jgi:hypothetical protein